MTSITTIKGDKLLRKRETKNSDHYATSEREKARTTAKPGRKGYSKKSEKASKPSQSPKKGGRANGGRKRQKGKRRQAFNLADLLPNETIKRLKAIK